MQKLYVWLTAIILLTSITIGWYLCNAVVLQISSNSLSGVTGEAFGLVSLIQFCCAWWGPIFDGIVILWAIMWSHASEPSSYAG